MPPEIRISAESTITPQQDGTLIIENLDTRIVTREQAIADISNSINSIRISRDSLNAQLADCDIAEAGLQQKLASLMGA